MKKLNVLKYAFAERGDRIDISMERDPKGLVSWEEGYPESYSQNPEANGKYILRPEFNGVMHKITSLVKEMQESGGSLYDSNFSYARGARVLVYVNILTNEIIEEPKEEGIISTMQLISLVDNNDSSPYEEGALFKNWWVDDGLYFGQVKEALINPMDGQITTTPPWLIDIGASDINTKEFSLNDYPRVKKAFEKTGANELGYFIKNEDNGTFKMQDLRGRFARIWSNGHTIDAGRGFSSLQNDAIRNINGDFWVHAWGGGSGLFNSWNGGNRHTGGDGGGINFNFNASRVVPTASENRPYNYNIKLYIKV